MNWNLSNDDKKVLYISGFIMPNMVYKASEHTLYENKELEILYKKVGRLLKETGLLGKIKYS